MTWALAQAVGIALACASLSACRKPQPGAATLVVCPPSGCPLDDRKPDPRGGGTLRILADAEPAGLCDLVNHEAWVRWIVENQVMETLVQQDDDGTIHPKLAESWRWDGVDAARRLVLSLRKNVTFHDGAPFDSADVRFTLAHAKDEKLGADQRSDLAPIVGIETPDAWTVVLRVPGPAPFLVQALAHIAMYPRHVLEHVDLRTAPFCRAPIGTGPFRFGSWESGVSIRLARWDGYWGEHPRLDGVDFRVVRDRKVASLLYERGELDVMTHVPHDHGPLPGHRIYRYTPHSFFFALWNTRRPALAAPATRVALARLFDLPRFVSVAFEGRARPHSGPYLEGTSSYAPIEPWAYDPRHAKTELGTTSLEHLTFLATTGSPAVEQLATLLEEDLRRVGIELTIERLDFARLLERLRRHDFDVAALQLTLSPEQDNFALFHSSAVDEQNWGGFSDPEADALLQRIRMTDDAETRHALDRQLHALLHARGPMTFLVAPEVDTAVAPGWGGVRPSASGFELVHAFRVAR